MITFAVTADNLCKQFAQDQARQNVGPNLEPKCLTLVVCLKEFFEIKFPYQRLASLLWK